jgi:predicted transcriptional regulator
MMIFLQHSLRLTNNFSIRRSELMKNRDRFEILSLILQIANGYNNVTMIKIMNRALLSYNQMKEHLMFLTEKDLLRYDEKTHAFKTTDKGMRFLQIYGRMEDMIRPPPRQRTWIERAIK